MKTRAIQLFTAAFLLFATHLYSQTIPKEELVFLTSSWEGERFEDGRPKISDDLVERAKHISVDDAWTVLKNEGYNNQFAGEWKMVNNNVVVGRAVTAMFMPSRPDVEKNIKDRGVNKQGRKGDTNSWPIDVLTTGDVYVADGFGKIEAGTLMGATLANSIFAKSGNGVVFNGSARDLESISELEGFNAFVRDFHPSFLQEMVLMGLNTAIRIGDAIVLPGDLVIGKSEGVLFVPAHLAEQVVFTSEFVGLKDLFGFEMVKAGKYSTGEIDGKWSDKVKKDFLTWLEKNPDKGKMTAEELNKVLEKRTW